MAQIKLGINTCFAVKRWPRSSDWISITKNELKLGGAQISTDLLSPSFEFSSAIKYMDVILVSGPMAGSGPDVRTLAEVREVVEKEIPVLLHTGAKSTTIKEFFKYADGCIVGSDLKRDGYTWNEVDPERAKRFIDAACSA